ncbi:MAG: carbohydrate kinase family protein [Chloroflexi bacterium HGW-Chloroflexi-2]|jgi:adenosine kinase|nr:MAG: carbohydrate kinase family protein [Chloroflexi bacterium HGW-Chloroflexi-2]
MSIVCTGSVAYDYLMKFPGYFKDHILPDNLETLSLSFLVESMTKVRGGIAPNIAYTLALLGSDKPVVFATVGEDFEDYRIWLEKHNVETKYIKKIDDVFTASFFANTDKANSQIASFYPGAMTFARDYSLKELDFTPELVVISPNDPMAMNRYVDECTQLKIPYLFDPSQQIVRMSSEEIRIGVEGAYSLFVNEYEYQLLQKHTGLSQNEILNIVKFLVVTLGNKGAVIYADDHEYVVPAFPVENIVDPTGVGDAFRGGFLRGYQEKFSWELCGKIGSLSAAYCLEQNGTQSHQYSVEKFVERFRQQYDDKGELDQILNKN